MRIRRSRISFRLWLWAKINHYAVGEAHGIKQKNSTLYLMCTMLTDTMSRKKRYNQIKTDRRVQREINTFPKLNDLLNSPFYKKEKKKYVPDKITGDRRFWTPDRSNDAYNTDGTKATYKQNFKSFSKNSSWYGSRQSFANPTKSVVCIRRKRRRECLFANNRIGKGSKVSSIRKRNWTSDIKC